jgi:outer membrane protein TolC
VLPNVSANYNYSKSVTDPQDRVQSQFFGPISIFSKTLSANSSLTSPSISGRWSLVDLSSWSSLSSARQGMEAANLNRTATRNDIVLEARTRFYEVVKAVRLAEVSAGALKLARDDERRVKALFEVGSVSKSDLLKARVRTSQSELDSLLANNGVTNRRIFLANLLAMKESELAEVDTSLVGERKVYDEGQVLADAKAGRPDILASEKELKAARASLNAARWGRLPSLDLSASANFPSKSKSEDETFYYDDSTLTSGSTQKRVTENTNDTQYRATLAVSMPIFDGFATDARIASSRARFLRSRETRDALVRNLESEVRQTMLGHQESMERERLARKTLESASENLNLVQQKYNVGSATILDLIDSQVQLQRAQSDLVSALAAIRVADATLARVRGRSE